MRAAQVEVAEADLLLHVLDGEVPLAVGAHDRDRPAPTVQRALVRFSVDTPCQAADHGDPLGSRQVGKLIAAPRLRQYQPDMKTVGLAANLIVAKNFPGHLLAHRRLLLLHLDQLLTHAAVDQVAGQLRHHR